MKNVWYSIKEKLVNFKEYLSEHKKAKWGVILLTIIIGAGIGQSVIKANEEKKLNAEIAKQAEEDLKNATGNSEEEDSNTPQAVIDFDTNQKHLEKKYGKAKKGYYWDDDGGLVARGDKNMKARDVGRIYMQSVSKMDAKQIEKFAYPSTVLKTFNKFYSKDADYSDSDLFKINAYKEVIKSLQVISVEDTINYASNKTVITYNVRYIDLTYRGFWTKDKDKLFSDMLETTLAEQDRQKVKKYLMDYTMKYYRSENPSYREGQVSLVLEKSATAGWLVTNDKNIDDLAKFPDNSIDNSPVGEILGEFENYYDEQEGAKPKWSNSNINDAHSIFDEPTEKEKNDPNGDKTLQGDTGEDASNPFD